MPRIRPNMDTRPTAETRTQPAAGFFQQWMEESVPEPTVANLKILRERTGARIAAEAAVRTAALDHLVGLQTIERIGGFAEAASTIRARIPTVPRVRSGDLGEILTSEYAEQRMGYLVSVKRLRWKDDRNMAMRGNDLLAIKKVAGHWNILKGESKSRARLAEATVLEAVTGLSRHSGRPNPTSLGLISVWLRDHQKDEEAKIYEGFLDRPPQLDHIDHLVFTFSGNDPTESLKGHAVPANGMPRRHLVGCVVQDHQQFIKSTFENLNAPVAR